MTTATVTTKCRITLPPAAREAPRVGNGDRVEFVETAPCRYEFIAATRSVAAVKGMPGKARKSGSVRR